jgi:hypothetical protein
MRHHHTISLTETCCNLQDWTLLRFICAPTIQWLYSGLDSAFVDETMTADEYVTHMSSVEGLGDSRSKKPITFPI